MVNPEDPTPDVPSISAGRRARLLLQAYGKEVLKLVVLAGLVYVLNSKASEVGVTDTPLDGELTSEEVAELLALGDLWTLAENRALPEGEYVFTCGECEGEGQVELITGPKEDDTEWHQCDECSGAGVIRVDDEEAAELILCGWEPDSRPA